MLHPQIQELIDRQQEYGGIDITKLKPGTKLAISTCHSLYRIKIINAISKEILIQGGKHVKKTTKAFLTGSTWGTSMIKLGWIGYLMHMEINLGNRILTTSPVKEATVLGEGWMYQMDWSVNSK